MTSRILVTGAPGNVGTEVVRALQEVQAEFRVGAWNVEQAVEVLGEDVEVVHFDFLDATTFAATFAGIEELFLVRPPQLANVEREIAPAIYAAIGAGVKHIVFLSLQGVENNRVVPHYKIEQLLKQAGITYTFLRASFFMQNLSTTHRDEIRDDHAIALPVGKARTSFIDVRDIAAVAAITLTQTGHENKAYTLTGHEALDYFEVATIMTDVLGEEVFYTNPSVITFLWNQISDGTRVGYALIMAALYTITRFGNAEEVTHDVEAILGHDSIRFRQFVQDYRHCWSV